MKKLHVHGDHRNPIFRFARKVWVKYHALRRWLSVEPWDGYRLQIFIR